MRKAISIPLFILICFCRCSSAGISKQLPTHLINTKFQRPLTFCQVIRNIKSYKKNDFQTVFEINSEMVFKDCDFADVVTAYKMINDQYKLCTFKRSVSFVNCRFQKAVNFRKAEFNSDVEFVNCIFEGDVNFEECSFRGNAFFKSSVFNAPVRFQNACFGMNTNFMNAEFRNDVFFQGSVFNLTAQFSVVLFAKYGDFSLCRFRSGAYFTYSKFYDRATFNNSLFFDELFLNDAETKEVSLENCSFYYIVNVSNVKVLKNLSFCKSNFVFKELIKNNVAKKIPCLD